MQNMGTRTRNHAKTMNNFSDTITKHIKNQHSLNPTQISLIQDRLKTIVSQFRTPDHLPYAAMIQRAILELKQKGGCTEKSISEFIKREYDDLPWAHCSLLKHHLEFLSKRGEIFVNRRFRYSLGGAGSSLGSMKGGKKDRRKKWKCNFERKRTKRLKLAIVVRSQEETERVIKDPSNDQNSREVGNSVIETEKCQNDGVQTPKKDGNVDAVQLQLITDQGENGIRNGLTTMNIDHPSLTVLTDGPENQVGLEQLQKQDNFQLKLHDPCYLHELMSPKRPPGDVFMGVEASDNQECYALQASKLIATEGSLLPSPTGSPLPSEKKKRHRNALPTQPIKEKEAKKKGRYLKGRQMDEMLEEREVLLALPKLQKRSPG